MPDQGSTRTDRRRVRTRTALIGAGQRLFADRHIDGVTIDDIVAMADVAKGSFYNHFDGKESFADAIVELVQADCEREISSVNEGITDAAVRIARAFAALIRYAQLHPDRYRALVNLTKRQANIDAPINAGMRNDMELGIASGQFGAITVESGMLATFALMSNSVDYLAITQGRSSPDTIALEMAFMLLRALGVGSAKAKSVAEAAVAQMFHTPAA